MDSPLRNMSQPSSASPLRWEQLLGFWCRATRVQGVSSARDRRRWTVPHVLQLFTSPDLMGNITPEQARNASPIEKTNVPSNSRAFT
eukprot:3814433-Amphidinium_carterae.1